MTKTLTLTNVNAAPEFSATPVGLNHVRIAISDGQGGEATLVLPRSQAQKVASAINGTANGQIREELEIGERAGTLTEAQVKRLGRIRDAAEHVARMNAERALKAAERKAAEAKPESKLKAVA